MYLSRLESIVIIERLPMPGYQVNAIVKEGKRIDKSLSLYLQEVLRPSRPRRWHRALVIWDSREDLEPGCEVLPNVHNRGNVSAAVAVIGGAPHGHHVLVLEMVLETFIDKLMGP
jgi:hypothetical protein